MARVLVVDDEPDILQSTSFLLKKMGHEVLTARDGRECLEKLRKVKVDLLLLDFFMPGMSGREVLERIRKDKNLKDTKVVMLTVARLSETGRGMLKKLKVLDFIQKPFEIKEFKKRVQTVLKK